MYHTSEPTLFDLTAIPGPLPHFQVQDTASTLSLPSESDDAASFLPDIDYFAPTEVGTMTSWDGMKMSDMAALDSFEKTFGSYVYPQ